MRITDVTAMPLYAVETQDELNRHIDSPTPVLIRGGILQNPITISRPFLCPPIIGDGSIVRVTCRQIGHPPTVIVEGDGAIVIAEKTARIICRGESTVWAKDQTKIRMYAGSLVATDSSKSMLYNDSTGTLRKRAKAYARNASRVRCMERSIAYLYHEAQGFRLHRTAGVYKIDSSARVYEDWLKQIHVSESPDESVWRPDVA